MKQNNLLLLSVLLLSSGIVFSGCEAIADIFKAGMWFGILGIVIVVVLIFWLIGKARR